MFLDLLANCRDSTFFQSHVFAAIEFLRQVDTGRLEPSAFGPENALRIDLNDGAFALIQRYQTKTPSEAFWEAHRKHIDLQFVVEGNEQMGWAPLSRTQEVKAYDPVKDFTVLQPRNLTDVSYLNLSAGMCAIFYPTDAHMPGLIAGDKPTLVKKIVVKVPVSS